MIRIPAQDSCDGCRQALTAGEPVVMTMALVPIEATRPVDPIWTYHRLCLGPPDASWREVYRGPLPARTGEGRRGVGRPRLVPRPAIGADLQAG